MFELCHRCAEDKPRLATHQCILCLDPLCDQHTSVVHATSATICSDCLAARREFGPVEASSLLSENPS